MRTLEAESAQGPISRVKARFEAPGLSENEVINDSKPNPVNWEDGILNLISPVSVVT
jgi:hypothetical protein